MKRKSKEPTMTLHTKAATDDIYNLFNQPLHCPEEAQKEEEDSSDDDYMTDGDYTSGGESSGTGRLVNVSDDEDADETSDVKNSSEWTDFSLKKNLPASQSKFEVMRETECLLDEKFRVNRQGQVKHYVNSCSSDILNRNESSLCSVLSTNSEPPSQSFRDLIQVSNNRLPLMTPITETTESSLDQINGRLKGKENLHDLTPSRESGKIQLKRMNQHGNHSLEDIMDQHNEPVNTNSSLSYPSQIDSNSFAHAAIEDIIDKFAMNVTKKSIIIKDAQCNPSNCALRKSILACVQPPLHTYQKFFDHTDLNNGKTAEIKKYIKAISKANRKGTDKTLNSYTEPVLQLPGAERHYVVKRELGAGTFAPVYLLESVVPDKNKSEKLSHETKTLKSLSDVDQRGSFEALKMEHEPSVWEFYIMRQARYRLGVSRTAESVIKVHEMHLFKDESYLIEDYRDQGTLLNIINLAKEDKSGPGVMDECLVIFFAIELFRTIEELHYNGILHGDLKADNCLVRFDPLNPNETLSGCYRRDGSEGWNKKGIALIDFGRGIDMYVFSPQVQFIADWQSTPQDCAEIREMRPWTYQIDYYGLAGILHSMLFGKYIDTVADNRSGVGPGSKKTWRLRNNLKRYWQTELWAEAFDLLLNATSHVENEENCKMPITRSLRKCREKMETWLEAKPDRGVRLQAGIRKFESIIARKK